MPLGPLKVASSLSLVPDVAAKPVDRSRRSGRAGARMALAPVTGMMISGCYGNVDRTLSSGNFVEREDATLAIEVDTKGAKLVVQRVEAKETRGLKAWPAEKWPVHCRMNMSADRLETFDMNGGALALGEVTFEKPLLSVECGGDKTVRIGNASGDERGMDFSTSIVFDRK